MRHAGQPGLLDHVMKATIPMRGRMIHGRTPLGELYEHAQDYDVKGRVSRALLRWSPAQVAICRGEANNPC